MFQVSLGPFVTCFLASIILTGYLHFILNKTRGIFKYHAKIIFSCLAFVMIRMLIPVNFPFTYSIYGTKIMNTIGYFFYFNLTDHIQVFNVLVWIWMCGASIQLMRYFIERKKIRRYLERYIISAQILEENDLDHLIQTSNLKNVRVSCIPEKTTPAIFGAFHPIIVLSKETLSCKDLEFILRHEIEHYHNYDLHLKIILDLLVAIYWWNPFVYGLRKKLNIVIEFSNDYSVSKDLNSQNRIRYAESLLRIAKENIPETVYDLALVNNFYLEERIHLLVDNDFISNRKKKTSMILNLMFLIVFMFAILFFVPEAQYSSKSEEDFAKESAFSIDSDNSFFIKNVNGYDLYVSGEYLTTIQKIPKELKEVPVYEKTEKQ